MSIPLDAQVRRLRTYVAAQSLVVIALLLMGFAQARQQPQPAQQQKFETIDVERINVREPDGTFRGHDVVKLLSFSDDFAVVYGSRTYRQFIWTGANPYVRLDPGLPAP